MASFLQKRIPIGVVVAVIFGAYAWHECRPLPWAAEMARATADACYQPGPSSDCRAPVPDLLDAEESYGPVRRHRMVSVHRGIMNNIYDVAFDVERERGRTRESIRVYAAYAPRQERRVASVWSATVVPATR